MNENIKNIIESVGTDSSGRWVSINDVEDIVIKTVEECVLLVKTTPTHCAITTHDLSAVNCTIEKSIDKINKHFELKEIGILQ